MIIPMVPRSRFLPTLTSLFAFLFLWGGCGHSVESAAPAVPVIRMVSLADNGVQANGDSDTPAINAEGNIVVFTSLATNLTATDTGGTQQVFHRDVRTGRTSMVSEGVGGTPPDGESGMPSIDNSGRFVAFESIASNLVAGESLPGIMKNIYVRDVATRTTRRISTSTDNGFADGNCESPSISGDGNLVVFASMADNLVLPARGIERKKEVYARNLQSGTIRRITGAPDNVTPPNGDSSNPVISRDGQYVAFLSYASNLVTNDSNGVGDVFLRDLSIGVTTLVSLDNAGRQIHAATPSVNRPLALSASPDGRYVFVAFVSIDNSIVPDDNNSVRDVFLRVIDTVTGLATTELVSVSASGSGTGNGYSDRPSISDDGRFVVLRSESYDLTNPPGSANKAEIFVRDRNLGVTRKVSAGLNGQDAALAGPSSVSANGAVIAFESAAENLVAGDVNRFQDIFIATFP